MKLWVVVVLFFVAGPAVGQIDKTHIEEIQKWIDGKHGRRAYKKAGEIVMPKLTKTTRFGWLEFNFNVEDIGRSYYWEAKKSGPDVLMVGYQNFQVKDIIENIRVGEFVVPRVVGTVDVPGKFKTGDMLSLIHI